MKKVIVAAFAALALLGCVNASDTAKKAPDAAPPQTEQTVRQSAPQPITSVTNADIDACKDAWASDWANEHHTTVAAAERYARRISTTPATTLRINGQSYVFNANAKGATVWSTCEASLKAARAAPAQALATARSAATEAVVAGLRAENQRLVAENYALRVLAYQNPEETNQDKLIPYQPQVTDLQRRLDEAERPVTSTMAIIAVLSALTGLGAGLFMGSRRSRRRPNRSIRS